MFDFWREATAALVPGFLCQSGRRRPENVTILSSLMQLSENNCGTDTGKPAFCSHAKHVTSRNSALRIWEGGKKFFHAVR